MDDLNDQHPEKRTTVEYMSIFGSPLEPNVHTINALSGQAIEDQNQAIRQIDAECKEYWQCKHLRHVSFDTGFNYRNPSNRFLICVMGT